MYIVWGDANVEECIAIVKQLYGGRYLVFERMWEKINPEEEYKCIPPRNTNN
jgi:hypothetical protein